MPENLLPLRPIDPQLPAKFREELKAALEACMGGLRLGDYDSKHSSGM